jgi:hypothetical protein
MAPAARHVHRRRGDRADLRIGVELLQCTDDGAHQLAERVQLLRRFISTTPTRATLDGLALLVEMPDRPFRLVVQHRR